MRYKKIDLEDLSEKEYLEVQDDIDFYQIHPLLQLFKLREKEVLPPPKPTKKNAVVTVKERFEWYPPSSGAQNTWESLQDKNLTTGILEILLSKHSINRKLFCSDVERLTTFLPIIYFQKLDLIFNLGI